VVVVVVIVEEGSLPPIHMVYYLYHMIVELPGPLCIVAFIPASRVITCELVVMVMMTMVVVVVVVVMVMRKEVNIFCNVACK